MNFVMSRMPPSQLLHRRASEYFGGRRRDGTAKWVKYINARAVVHTLPRRWTSTRKHAPVDLVVEAWLPSLTYNAPLAIYSMANCVIGCAPDGRAFGKPSHLGFWVVRTPWDPWTQTREATAWTPADDSAAASMARRSLPSGSPRTASRSGLYGSAHRTTK